MNSTTQAFADVSKLDLKKFVVDDDYALNKYNYNEATNNKEKLLESLKIWNSIGYADVIPPSCIVGNRLYESHSDYLARNRTCKIHRCRHIRQSRRLLPQQTWRRTPPNRRPIKNSQFYCVNNSHHTRGFSHSRLALSSSS
jgi:hypothetical protein